MSRQRPHVYAGGLMRAKNNRGFVDRAVHFGLDYFGTRRWSNMASLQTSPGRMIFAYGCLSNDTKQAEFFNRKLDISWMGRKITDQEVYLVPSPDNSGRRGFMICV